MYNQNHNLPNISKKSILGLLGIWGYPIEKHVVRGVVSEESYISNKMKPVELNEELFFNGKYVLVKKARWFFQRDIFRLAHLEIFANGKFLKAYTDESLTVPKRSEKNYKPIPDGYVKNIYKPLQDIFNAK